MFKVFKVLFWKYISYLAARFLYGPLSRLYRKLVEKKYIDFPQDVPWNEGQVLKFFNKCTWESDPVAGMFDVISKPEKFYITRRGDCDEYAAFASTVLPYKSFILSVTWLDPRKKGLKQFKGHNVCIFFKNKGFWHISNWGLRGEFKRPQDVWYDIVPKDCIPCAYSIRYDDTLKWLTGGILKKGRKRG